MKNVFYHSSYFNSWSVILFHRSQATERLADQLGIPKHIETVELDLLGEGFTNFDDIDLLHIRAHCTQLRGKDIVGHIPEDVFESLAKGLSSLGWCNGHARAEELCSMTYKLLEGIDWQEYSRVQSGGATLNLCSKVFLGV